MSISKYKEIIVIYGISLPISACIIYIVINISDAFAIYMDKYGTWPLTASVLYASAYLQLQILRRLIRKISVLRGGLDVGVFDVVDDADFGKRIIDILWLVLMALGLAFVVDLKADLPELTEFPIIVIFSIRALELTSYSADTSAENSLYN